MAESPELLMQAAAELARLAGGVAMRHFRTGVTVEQKSDGSPVTVADREAERVARDWLLARFPADGVLGEEFGLERGQAPRRWVMDPIDGTKSFVRGVPLWGTLIACCEGQQVLSGAAFFPATDELICAAPGCGSWYNGERAYVSGEGDLSAATVLVTDERFPERPARRAAWRDLAASAGVVRTWGDCYGYLLVATGRAEAMVDDLMNPWDAAAVQPIIEEAGGVFTSWHGVPTAFAGSSVATNALLASTVRRVLAPGEFDPALEIDRG
ncbi:MAG: histidinol phosphate phosphatase [Gemmatimonadaceae bacterium]|jgi:histidinol phosphatase-like enzyme (inositol monophosphatase family)|nr:histidinol phosphate phosphatase [Gemmatimonadaceae bacterium]